MIDGILVYNFFIDIIHAHSFRPLGVFVHIFFLVDDICVCVCVCVYICSTLLTRVDSYLADASTSTSNSRAFPALPHPLAGDAPLDPPLLLASPRSCSVCVCVCVYVCVCVCVCVCVYVCQYVYVYMYMYICIYVHMYICIYVYMYIHIQHRLRTPCSLFREQVLFSGCMYNINIILYIHI